MECVIFVSFFLFSDLAFDPIYTLNLLQVLIIYPLSVNPPRSDIPPPDLINISYLAKWHLIEQDFPIVMFLTRSHSEIIQLFI